MIVCLCHGITEGQIKQCIEKGDSVLAVVKKTGAGSCCGSCVEVILELVGESDDQEEDDPLCEAEGRL